MKPNTGHTFVGLRVKPTQPTKNQCFRGFVSQSGCNPQSISNVIGFHIKAMLKLLNLFNQLRFSLIAGMISDILPQPLRLDAQRA